MTADETRRRTNRQWLGDLRTAGAPAREAAVLDLSRFLRSGLAKAIDMSALDEADLEDFTQDAMVRILDALDSFRGDSRFTTWAMAIALRVAYSALRKRRSGDVSLDQIEKGAQIAESIWSQGSLRADDQLQRDQVLEALRSAIIERLTERQRTVILAEIRGVASERTAELLGSNRNAIYKVYHDARKKLRDALNEAGFGNDDLRAILDVAT